VNGYEYRGQWIRPEMIEALRRYVEMRCPVGGFLTAVLSNDLMNAAGKADDGNFNALGAYCAYLYNHMPAACHGSREKVAAWLNAAADGGARDTEFEAKQS
jgi:hypothetical protein